MEVVFEPGDEVRWVSAIQIVGEEADLDVGIGDGDPDLVLEGRDALGTDSEPAESADLSGGSAGLGRGLVELLLEEALEVLARVHSLGVDLTVVGHGELLAARRSEERRVGKEGGS